jgi:pyridoxine 4-dehydrogenase
MNMTTSADSRYRLADKLVWRVGYPAMQLAGGARFVDQLGALAAARDEGLIGGVGISNVGLDHLTRALEVTEIVCVQNFFNLADRTSLPILRECSARGIAFVALAWLLAIAPDVLLIPGTRHRWPQ